MPTDYLADIKKAPAGGTDYLADLKKTDNSTWTSKALARGKQGAQDVVTNDYERIKANAQAAFTGVLSFGASLLGGLPNIDKNNQMFTPKRNLAADVKSQNDQYTANLAKYGQGLQVPYMAGQVAGSSFLNPAMKGIMAAPGLAAQYLPTGLKTIGKLATGAVSGMAAGGLFGAATYDPSNPEGGNIQAAEEYGLNPLSAGLGVVGSSLGSWAAQANKLAQAESKGYGTMVMNRDLKPKVKVLADNTYGSLPVIGDASTRLAQQQSFIPGIQKFIKSISAEVGENIATSSGTNTLNSAVKSALKSVKTRITADEKAIWSPIDDVANKIFLDGSEFQSIKQKVRDFVNTHSEITVTNKGLWSFLQKGILDSKKPHQTFEQLKQTKSMIQKYLNGKHSMSQPASEDGYKLVQGLYENLDQSIYKVDPALVPAYHKATAFTAAKYKMFNEAGNSFKAAYKATDLEKAVADNAAAYDFATTLIKENSPDQIKASMAMFTSAEANKIRAGIVGKALKESIHPSTNNFNINKFLKLTSEEKNIDVLMGSTYQSLKGLNELMQPVQQALNTMNKGKEFKQGIAYGAMGGGAALDPISTAAVVASTAALVKISHYSPLKRILIAVTGAKTNPRLLEKISKEAHSKLQRYGLIIGATPDGSPHVQSKEEGQR